MTTAAISAGGLFGAGLCLHGLLDWEKMELPWPRKIPAGFFFPPAAAAVSQPSCCSFSRLHPGSTSSSSSSKTGQIVFTPKIKLQFLPKNKTVRSVGLVIAAEVLPPSLRKADLEALQCTSHFSLRGGWGPAQCAGVQSGRCCALPPSLLCTTAGTDPVGEGKRGVGCVGLC